MKIPFFNLGYRLYIFLCCIPVAVLGYSVVFAPSANPVEQMLHFSGDWAFNFLLMTLAVTPLRKMTPIMFNWVILRRTLGLAAFFYALLHLVIFVIFDLQLSFTDLATEIIERKYILVGFLALCILLPLAITSTNRWQRKLKRNWLKLHKGVYFATALVCLHYFMLVKADYFYPIVYTSIFVLLMVMRIDRKRLLKYFYRSNL